MDDYWQQSSMQNVLILSAGRRVELVSAFANELKHALPV